MLNEIMDILTPRRMMTVGNLALGLGIEPEVLHPHLEQLAADGRVRYAQSKCDGVCSSCSTCNTSSTGDSCAEEGSAVDPTVIVISLELRDQEN